MASRQALRKSWWQVHKWGGLLLMILFIPLGLSGIVLAWDDAIDHALNPQRYAVQGAATLAPSTYAQAAAGSLKPDERVSQIRYPGGEAGPVMLFAIKAPHRPAGDGHKADEAGGDGERKGRHEGARRGPPQRITLWLDPQSGRVLDVERGDTGLIRLAHDFHGTLFIPGGPGRALIGLLGFVMFLMAVGGIWLWWPPVGAWVKGLRWRRGDRRLDTNLHHRVGFWVALPLAAQAFTGVWMAWPQMMAVAGLAPTYVGPMERARMAPMADPQLSPDKALAAAEAATPGQPTLIAWPTGGDGPWRITLRTRRGPSEMLVDDASAAVRPAPRRAGGGIAMTMRHYHDGTTLGPVWRGFLVLLGLTPTLLGITGLLMWLRGRRWRAEAARRRRDVRQSVAAG